MAKRKRLSPAQNDFLGSGAAEAAAPGPKPGPLGPAPIAQVAGEAAAASALQELAGEMTRAREEGRLIQTLDVAQIEDGYLVRDRLVAEDEELQALVASIRTRGQQTPIEVVALPEGRFGLISGWRRLTALRHLAAETGEAQYSRVKALLRRPETASDAYVAMVEENEIRVGLSYYERARVAAKAVEQGVYDTEKAALLSLYASASRPKRSKIRSFLRLYHAADAELRFPAAIGERLGLAVSKFLDDDPQGPAKLKKALTRAPASEAEEELALLRALVAMESQKPEAMPEADPEPAPEKAATTKPEKRELRAGVYAAWNGKALTLSGPAVSEAFQECLCAWIAENSNPA